jgi:hypothetical protein
VLLSCSIQFLSHIILWQEELPDRQSSTALTNNMSELVISQCLLGSFLLGPIVRKSRNKGSSSSGVPGMYIQFPSRKFFMALRSEIRQSRLEIEFPSLAKQGFNRVSMKATSSLDLFDGFPILSAFGLTPERWNSWVQGDTHGLPVLKRATIWSFV